MSSPTVDLQASQKVSSVNLSMILVLPTPREPIMIIWSLKSAGLGGIFLRRDWAPRAGDEFAEPPPPPAALRGMSYLESISNSTFVMISKTDKRPYTVIQPKQCAISNFLLSPKKFAKVCHSPTVVVVQPLETGAVMTSLTALHHISASAAYL